MITVEHCLQQLQEWFQAHSRDLPWRHTYDPYQVWVSEIMLQQTQMERAVIYFNRWLQRFPDIDTLAAADENEVLSYWEGLGYYSRARNLHRAAQLLAGHGNTLPAEFEILVRLPGIGPYTAGAIMSIAFNRDYPVVDANIERIFARIFNISTPVKSRANKTFIWEKAGKLLPVGKSRFFNQSLMELGALVCLPSNPRCDRCPLAGCCQALHLGIVRDRPVLPPKKKSVSIEMATGLLIRDGKILIQKRRADDVWGNLWEFPGGRLKEGESPEQGVVREFQEETGLRIARTERITSVKHSYMHYRVTLHGFFCETAGDQNDEPALHAAQENRWVSFNDLRDFAFPAGHRKLIDFLQKSGARGQKPE